MKRDRERKISSVSKGSSQSERTNIILNSDYFRIDERELPDYLALLYRLSEEIHFYNIKNKPEGDWQPFLGSDISILLSRIAILNTEKMDGVFSELLYQFENEIDESKSIRLYQLLEAEVFDLVLKLDEWYKTAHAYSASDEDSELGNLIENAIEYRLSSKFKRFRSLVRGLNEQKLFTEGHNFDGLDKVWESGKFQASESVSLEGNMRDVLSRAVKQLTFVFKDFLRSVTYIVNTAPILLEKSLKHEHHAPQNALLIAFVKLLNHVKGDLNKITTKHLDYYYFHKLKQTLKDAVPDRAHVHFTLADHIDEYLIEKGALFSAGIDEEGYDYLYEADHDLLVNQTKIDDVKVLYLSKNPMIGVDDKYKLISNIYKAEVSSAGDDAALSFPTFGEDQQALGHNMKSMSIAGIGFAISSPVLLMREGDRKVSIDVKLNLKSMSSLVTFLEDFSKQEQVSADGAFSKIFANAFEMQLSTEEGWHNIDNYKVAPKQSWTDGVMSIFFELDLSEPPVTALSLEQQEAEQLKTQWPVLKVALSTSKSMYAYSYLRELIIEACKIDVEVSHIKGLNVFNSLGKLDVSAPFYPFGTTPGVGSFMLVGHDELFKKEIDDISIDMEWQNLPRLENGFKEYYKKYGEDITNESFKVSLKALSGYQFLPQTKKKLQVFDLFKTKKNKAGTTTAHTLSAENKLANVDVEALQIKSDFKMTELPEYDNTTKSGYLKLELVEPGMGFGHDMYAELFANEVMKKASSKEAVELPKVPFAPQLRTIQLNYKASSSIIFEKTVTRRSNPEADEKFYHIHPFGTKAVFKNTIPYDQYFLPQLDEDGYLYIGLTGLDAPATVTLYFVLEQRVSNNFEVDMPDVHWQYLADDRWVDFNRSDVIFDTTNGFTVSGIVKLAIPIDITDNNNILPKGKFWISARVEGDVNLLSYTKAIHTQAMSVTWKSHKPGAQWQKNIPAGKIERFLQGRSEIAAVAQPLPSFSGVPQENLERFYARVSERLRHKNRAVTPWDFEHLILEKFPFIARVKCITPTDDHDRVKGGELVAVVMPQIDRQLDFYLPKINYDTLSDIRKALVEMSSPFVNIKVVNPVYEQVKVSCKIKFVNNENKGEYIHQLHEDLRRFLCPWFYKSSERVSFGGSIKHEEVLTFLESLDYIAFITKLAVVIVHYDNEVYSLSDSTEESKTLYTSAPWSILVPMQKHQVAIIEKTIHESPEKAAIENMRLGGDFVVAEERQEEFDDDFPPYRKEENKEYYVIEIDI